MVSKKDIRRNVLARRNAMNSEEWENNSRVIFEKLTTHPFFLNANTIFSYIDYQKEVCTRTIIEAAWNAGKRVAVPKIEQNEMCFYYIDSFDELIEGYKGILEPVTQKKAAASEGLVILPGSAFDRKRNRIGYGKGFYDRFLSAHPNLKTIALAFEMQIVEQIMADAHDIRPEQIITEEQIYV